MTLTEIPAVETRNGTKSLSATNDKADKAEISKLRAACPQVCAVSAKNLLLITFGSTLGFPTILLPALQSDQSDIDITREQLTWISSINLFMVPLGCLLSGPLSQFLGRKKTMLIANIPFIAAWLILYYATAAPFIFVALALTGLTGGMIEAPVLTYVAEVTQPHLRGMLSATSSMSVIVGVFTQLLTGSLTDWRTASLFNLIYPLTCFFVLCFMPESPYWLAGQDRIEDAEKSLCWLRGWVSPIHVREELVTVCDVVKHPAGEENASKEGRWKGFKRRTFWGPFVVVILAFFIANFGGSSTLQTYAVFIFNQMRAPIDKYTSTVFLGVSELCGTAFCVLAIHFTGKRKLAFVSIAGAGLSFLGSTIYIYVIEAHEIGDKYSWLPTTLLIGGAFFSHMGIRLLPWILCGEVFPTSIRGVATGVSASSGYIFASIVNKTFLYMVDGLGLSGTFLFYFAVNLVGGIILFFLLPETEGRTLKEIEEHFAGVQRLSDKPKRGSSESKEKWAANNPGLVVDDVESKL